MAYLTVAQADVILDGQGLERGWSDLDDTQKLEYLQRASNRIEMLRFETDRKGESYPRYRDGLRRERAIPLDLSYAVALLAYYYVNNPHSVLEPAPERNSIATAMSDLPLAVQTALWPYIAESLKDNPEPEEPEPYVNVPDPNEAHEIAFGTGDDT